MKKIMMSFLAIMVLVLTVQSVSAEEPTSDSTVSFVGNEEPTGPVDPENPDEPGGPGTGMEGPLSIDYVPNLPFGQHPITGGIETYESTNLKPYLQVSDTRGTGAGWTVTVTLGDFESTTTASATLPDAKLTFTSPVVKKPTANTGTAPTSPSSVELTAGGVGKTIFTAATGAGMGTWLTSWLSTETTNEKVTLEVNTNTARNEAYEATLNWSLTLTP